MTTVKKGSKGEAVKQLQMILGITADGIFGPITRAVVIAYQSANGLKADGIVGPKTWGKLLGEEPDHGFRLRISCGKGTYIRSICDDLGKLCGCPAQMRSLVRIRSSYFTLAESLSLETARELAAEGRLSGKLIPMDRPIAHLPRMNVPAWMAKAVSAGAKLPLDKMQGEAPAEGGITRIYLQDAFWGIAARNGNELVWRAQIPPDQEAEKQRTE